MCSITLSRKKNKDGKEITKGRERKRERKQKRGEEKGKETKMVKENLYCIK